MLLRPPCCPHFLPAGFHNASLYGALEPAIVPLVQLLRDEEVRVLWGPRAAEG